MALNERRISGRDVLAKTFHAKTKRGYDPIEVDAYLELVAAQIDMIHGDLTTASAGTSSIDAAKMSSIVAERDAYASEIETVRTDRDRLAVSNEELTEAQSTLAAENEQLRSQVSAVAPPPPSAPESVDTVEVAEVADDVSLDTSEIVLMPPIPSDADDEPSTDLVASDNPDARASEESYELVLRMARRSAEETIAEAHSRADEIVADANFTAAQISRESDRKAFDAANKVQSDLAAISEEIEQRQAELRHLDGRSEEQRGAMRELASRILLLADDDPRKREGVSVVDLRAQDSENA